MKIIKHIRVPLPIASTSIITATVLIDYVRVC
jgi:hypothetical protein